MIRAIREWWASGQRLNEPLYPEVSELDEARGLLKWVSERSREGCFSRKRSERDRALSDINYRTEKYCK